MNKLYIICLLLFVCCSKSVDKQTESAARNEVELLDKTIVFPPNTSCNVLGKTVPNKFCDELLQSKIKLLVYVDSFGCSNCRLKLNYWKSIISDANLYFKEQLVFLFFFQPSVKTDMEYLFGVDDFDYPVFIDIDNRLATINKFPRTETSLCLLLDEKNKVIASINLSKYPKFWEYYKRLIRKQIQQ